MDIVGLDRRAAALTVLSRLLLKAPGADALAALRDPAQLAEWPTPEGASEGLALLAGSEESADDIRIDHQRLFGGAGPARANPFESVHRSEEGLKFDDQTIQVRAAYRELGLQAPRLNKEPDDHIGLELEFMATAYLRAAELLEAGSRQTRCWPRRRASTASTCSSGLPDCSSSSSRERRQASTEGSATWAEPCCAPSADSGLPTTLVVPGVPTFVSGFWTCGGCPTQASLSSLLGDISRRNLA